MIADDLAEQIVNRINQLGKNKVAIPFATDYHDNEWWVYIDVNTRYGTFDIETHHAERATSLKNALSQLRRAITCAA